MTADTSAVVAALSAWHDQHDAAAEAVAGVTALPAHVLLETYSVLTRLPAGLAIPAETAAAALSRRFPDTPLRLDEAARTAILPRLATAGVYGGAAYDGLVALEAQAHDHALLTLDRRAQVAYRRLAVPFRVVGG